MHIDAPRNSSASQDWTLGLKNPPVWISQTPRAAPNRKGASMPATDTEIALRILD